MRIPKRFKQYGHTIEVLRKVVDPVENRDRVAFASYRLNELHIRLSSESMPLNDEQVGHAFCHELVHFILYGASVRGPADSWLHQDEDVVDRLGGLLHQALTTMEYEEATCTE